MTSILSQTNKFYSRGKTTTYYFMKSRLAVQSNTPSKKEIKKKYITNKIESSHIKINKCTVTFFNSSVNIPK